MSFKESNPYFHTTRFGAYMQAAELVSSPPLRTDEAQRAEGIMAGTKAQRPGHTSARVRVLWFAAALAGTIAIALAVGLLLD